MASARTNRLGKRVKRGSIQIMKFDIDIKDLVKLLGYLDRAPRKFAAAQTMWVNRAAFGTRTNALDHINRTMIVRSAAFTKNRVRVKKAPRGSMYKNREAVVGSVKTPRHTGWAEQEGLRSDERDKTITLAARGGSKQNRVRPSMRLKKNKRHPKPTDFKGRSRRQKANAMLQEIGATRSKKPFVVFGHRHLKSGLWRFGNGSKGRRKLIPVQLFSQKPQKPRKNPWMRDSVKKYFRRLNRKQVWKDIIRRAGALPTGKRG